MTLRKPIIFFCAALLVGCLASCGGLAGEPRIISTLVPATPAPTDIGYPLAPPDIAVGAQIYAQNCVACHGVGGKGDGERVQSGQVSSPPDFTDPTTASAIQPVAWFTTITNGNLANLMPLWHDALSEQQRWDVALYTYTLADTPDQIARGREAFNAVCAECDLSALTDLRQMASLSSDDLVTLLTSGGANIPPLADQLSDAQRHDAAAYLRTLALTNADAVGTSIEAPVAPAATEEIGASATPEVTIEPSIGTVTGQVSNGTEGGTLPSDIQLTLFYFDASFNQTQLNAAANADGSFSFSDVPLDPTYAYVVTTTYRDRIFASDVLRGAPLTDDLADNSLDLPVTIYELTEDPDVIQIAGMVMQVSAIGTGMEVAQVFNFKNSSDRAFTTSENTSDGRAISLVITLPPGAVVMGFQDSQNRFVTDQDNFTIFDTVPVLPGEDHVVQVVYLIQYDKDAIIEQPMNYALNGPVRLLLNPMTISVTSQQLQPLGTETLGNTQYQSYGADLSLAAGDVVRYDLSGAGLNAATQGDANAPVVSSSSLILLIVGVLIIAALLGGGLFVIASRSRSGDSQVIDILVRQIAELDADHDAGKIDDTAYDAQRSALKARLAALMERKK